mmetsp:Transcript_73282/g.238400  ORF Transcript_73282/g.238400 Transcript_73282/m.238400 type:complete len:292 (-) Transcript_73282:815-1690(-)
MCPSPRHIRLWRALGASNCGTRARWTCAWRSWRCRLEDTVSSVRRHRRNQISRSRADSLALLGRSKLIILGMTLAPQCRESVTGPDRAHECRNSRAPSRQKLSFNKNTSLSMHVPAVVVRRMSHDPLVAGLVLQVGDRVHVVRLLGDQCLQVELGFVHLGLSLQFLLLLLLPRNLQLLAPIMPLDLIVPPLLVEVLHGAAGLGGEEGRPEVRAAEEGHASAEELHEHGPAPCGHWKARGQGARRQTSLLGVAVEEPRLHRPVEVQQLAAAAASDDEGRDLALLGEVPAEDP